GGVGGARRRRPGGAAPRARAAAAGARAAHRPDPPRRRRGRRAHRRRARPARPGRELYGAPPERAPAAGRRPPPRPGAVGGRGGEAPFEVAAGFAAAADRFATVQMAVGPLAGASLALAFDARLPVVPLYHRSVRVHYRKIVYGLGFDGLGRLSLADAFVFAG